MTPSYLERINTWRSLYDALLDIDPERAEALVDVEKFGAVLHPMQVRLGWQEFLAETKRRRRESGAHTVEIDILHSGDHGYALMVYSRTTITVHKAQSSIRSVDMATFDEGGRITNLLIMPVFNR